MRRFFAAAFALALLGCVAKTASVPGGQTLSTAGGAIFVRALGPEAGPALLLIHGTTSHSGDFDVAFRATLGSTYRLIAYDRPGMGRSYDRPVRSETLAIQAETAADVIRAEHPNGPLVVIGHSYGGAVALRLALDHPELVSGLVLLAPAMRPWAEDPPLYDALESTPVLGDLVTLLAWPFASPVARNSLKTGAFAPLSPPEGYFERAEVGLALRPAAARASAADLVALQRELAAQSSRYAALRLPVSIILGAKDRIIPFAWVRAGERPFAHGRVVVVPDAGHMVQHAAPAAIDQEIRWVIQEGAAAPT